MPQGDPPISVPEGLLFGSDPSAIKDSVQAHPTEAIGRGPLHAWLGKEPDYLSRNRIITSHHLDDSQNTTVTQQSIGDPGRFLIMFCKKDRLLTCFSTAVQAFRNIQR